MALAREKFTSDIERFIALQFLFDSQWKAVKVLRPVNSIDMSMHLPPLRGHKHAAEVR